MRPVCIAIDSLVNKHLQVLKKLIKTLSRQACIHVNSWHQLDKKILFIAQLQSSWREHQMYLVVIICCTYDIYMWKKKLYLLLHILMYKLLEKKKRRKSAHILVLAIDNGGQNIKSDIVYYRSCKWNESLLQLQQITIWLLFSNVIHI